LPAVQPDGAIRDGEAQARASGVAVAGIIEPVKGLKDLLQRFLGHAGAGIEHANNHLFLAIRGLAFQLHLHRRTFSSITCGVPHDVLDRAAEQVGVSFDEKFVVFLFIFILAIGG